jgi:hypothetical protein
MNKGTTPPPPPLPPPPSSYTLVHNALRRNVETSLVDIVKRVKQRMEYEMRHPGIPYAMGKAMESMIMSIKHAHNMEIKGLRAKKRMETRRKRAEKKKARMEEEETWHHQCRCKEVWTCLQEMIHLVEEEGPG